MARINKQEVLQEMQEGLRLDTALEKTPSELADKILPTYTVNPRPRIITVEDTIVNEQTKTFIVPNGKQWKFLYGHVQIITDANVANRELRIFINNSNGAAIYNPRVLNVQTASTTERYNLGQFGDVLEPTAGNHYIPFPVNSILLENFEFTFQISLGQAGDDMTIRLIVEESDMQPNR